MAKGSLEKDYDFVDLGSGPGGTVMYARSAFNGKSALGVDVKPEAEKNAKDYDFVCGDITKMNFRKNMARFVTMGHFLEHSPSLVHAANTMRKAITAARDFVFITNPAFDGVLRLRDYGLKFYWEQWIAHTAYITADFLHGVCAGLKMPHIIFGSPPVRDSTDTDIQCLGAPYEFSKYDASKHPPKKFVKFDPPLFRGLTCFIWCKGYLEYRGSIERSRMNNNNIKLYEG